MTSPLPRHWVTALLFALAVSPSAFAVPSTSYPSGYGPMRQWLLHGAFCMPGQPVDVGDFNGDGLDDLVCFWKGSYPETDSRYGDVFVALSNGDGFDLMLKWHDFYSGTAEEISLAGDFNGDGRDDLVNFNPPYHSCAVNLSTGTAFSDTGSTWSSSIISTGQVPLVGDFNRDGLDDVAVLVRGDTGDVWVALSTGSAFGELKRWGTGFCTGKAKPDVGDFNGDGFDDLVCFVQDTATAPARGDVNVILSTGSAFGASEEWTTRFAMTSGSTALATDINADGFDDIVDALPGGIVVGSLNIGGAFAPPAKDSFLGIWQRHTEARKNTGEEIVAGRFNHDLNGDIAMLPRDQRTGIERGSVFAAIGGGHAIPEEEGLLSSFGYGTMGGGTASSPAARGSRPLLVILTTFAEHLDIDDDTPAGPNLPWVRSRAEYDTAFFGPGHPNIAGYFSEMSGGLFTYERAGPGIVEVSLPVMDQGTDPVQAAADAGFDYRPYDLDADGLIEVNELTIVCIGTKPGANWIGGAARDCDLTITFPTGPSTRIFSSVVRVTDDGAFDLYAHELSHTLGTVDIYGHTCFSDGVSLMHCNAGPVPSRLVHLDPWHKMRLGWLKPKLIDFRYPGAAFVKCAQKASGSKNPPILFFDGSRPDFNHEYYLVDFRYPGFKNGTQTWLPTNFAGTWRIPQREVGTLYQNAGYDINAAGTGLVRWYVGTEDTHSLILDYPGIKPGADGTLQSVLAGDDVAAGADIFWGPDGILDTAKAGEDDYFLNVRLFPALDPRNVADRGSVEFLDRLPSLPSDRPDPAHDTLRWMSGNDTGLSIRTIGFAIPSSESAALTEPEDFLLDWGTSFRPFISGLVSAPTMLAGRYVVIRGTMGSRQYASVMVLEKDGLIKHSSRHYSYQRSEEAGFEIYRGFEPGRYRLRFQRVDGYTILDEASNSIFIEIINPLHPWRLAHGLPADADDLDDPDTDGRVNIIEAIQGTDPRFSDLPPPPAANSAAAGQILMTKVLLPPNDGQSKAYVACTRFVWSYVAFDHMEVECETSTDLRTWSTVPLEGNPRSLGGGVMEQTGLIYLDDAKARFARLRVTYRTPQ